MLPSKMICYNARRLLPVFLSGFILTACHLDRDSNAHISIQGPATSNSGYYLQQAQNSDHDSKADWQLLAIRALLNENQYTGARQQLSELPTSLTAVQQQEWQLLQSQLQIADHDNDNARLRLDKLDPATLSHDQQMRYYTLYIAASQNHPSLSLLRVYIAQEPLLQGPEHQKNIDATWQTLTTMTAQQTEGIVINASENTLQGWLDLLNTWRAGLHDPDHMQSAISEWQQRYPHNPAAQNLPVGLSMVSVSSASTHKVALLLPLTGQAQVFSQAISRGFSDAKNATGGASTNNSEIKVYDTAGQPLSQILNQLQQDGATLVVGPLLKTNVDKMLTSPLAVNVLALNTPHSAQNRPNVCYFALSPEDEARDAAHHLWDQGKRTPLLLLPRTSLGNRISAAFDQEWQQLGGGMVQQQSFGSIPELKSNINSGAGIRLTGTPVIRGNTAAGPASATGQQMQSQPISFGKKVDAVYIVSTQDELQLIKPMIAMKTSSRDSVALYASSRSSQAGAGPDFRLEVDGLQFSDIPLLAGANPDLMKKAAHDFNNDYSLIRLYAMGMDAWTLASQFASLRQQPDFHIDGNTGTLSASQDCVVNRKLIWLQYHQGQIVPAS